MAPTPDSHRIIVPQRAGPRPRIGDILPQWLPDLNAVRLMRSPKVQVPVTDEEDRDEPEIPAWFADALGQSCDSGDIEVDGVRIVYRAWGKSGDPVAILVHGGAAHAGWWDHVAPHLAAGHRVIAIDLSGHGDSGHRQAYSLETWADEVMAVAAAESDQPPVLLGHSMGGSSC